MASYSILLTKSAAKELESVPTKDRRRIVMKIGTLANNPRPVGAEKLSRDDKYRIRQGDYHILYEIVDAGLIVTVVRIGNRREVCRR
ncbi:MAG TPA: type II toxin-antitoxin system RelE/ParE family toxin [Gemmatimonadaceae bacterium]